MMLGSLYYNFWGALAGFTVYFLCTFLSPYRTPFSIIIMSFVVAIIVFIAMFIVRYALGYAFYTAPEVSEAAAIELEEASDEKVPTVKPTADDAQEIANAVKTLLEKE